MFRISFNGFDTIYLSSKARDLIRGIPKPEDEIAKDQAVSAIGFRTRPCFQPRGCGVSFRTMAEEYSKKNNPKKKIQPKSQVAKRGKEEKKETGRGKSRA
jgi:hypothetical protein